MQKPTLEVCIDDMAGLQACIDTRPDRIELCSALPLGGLTPSAGLMKKASQCSIPTRAMIRPRAGDFVYDHADIDIMLHDIAMAQELGLEGVVLGAALADGHLDQNVLRTLCQAASGMKQTLHRVFDCTPDIEAALEIAIDLGFDRILTSGGATNAHEGIANLARLQICAQGRIEILVGGGVDYESIESIAKQTTIRHVHSSCSHLAEPNPIATKFGFDTTRPRQTDPAQITALKSKLALLFNQS